MKRRRYLKETEVDYYDLMEISKDIEHVADKIDSLEAPATRAVAWQLELELKDLLALVYSQVDDISLPAVEKQAGKFRKFLGKIEKWEEEFEEGVEELDEDKYEIKEILEDSYTQLNKILKR